MNSPILARIFVGLHLREALRTTTDAQTKTGVSAVLSDESKLDDVTAQILQSNGMTALPSGWLANLLAFLEANLPSILALIASLFGGLVPPPVPAKLEAKAS